MFGGSSPGRHAAEEQQRKAQVLRADLAEQVALKNERKEREAAEARRHEARQEAEANAYSPWGRGGAGAPLRDVDGRVISSLQVRWRHVCTHRLCERVWPRGVAHRHVCGTPDLPEY